MDFYNGWVKRLNNEYGTKALSNYDIDDMGRKYLGESYGGVFPADIFVEKNKQIGKIYIVNDENADKPGRHWMTFIQDPEGLLCYDSYAGDITKYNKIFKKLKYKEDRSDREQRYNTDHDCGCRAMSAGISYKKLGRESFLTI